MSDKENSIYFLSAEDSRFFKALCSAVVPEGIDTKSEPGALTVGALHYVDSTLVDFPKEVQEYFRAAVKIVNEESKTAFSKDFAELSDSDRNIVLRNLFLNPRTREQVFDLRSIVLEGYYSDYKDPDYNGTTAWEFVRFGGKRISDLKKDWTFLKIWKDWEVRKSH